MGIDKHMVTARGQGWGEVEEGTGGINCDGRRRLGVKRKK